MSIHELIISGFECLRWELVELNTHVTTLIFIHLKQVLMSSLHTRSPLYVGNTLLANEQRDWETRQGWDSNPQPAARQAQVQQQRKGDGGFNTFRTQKDPVFVQRRLPSSFSHACASLTGPATFFRERGG